MKARGDYPSSVQQFATEIWTDLKIIGVNPTPFFNMGA